MEVEEGKDEVVEGEDFVDEVDVGGADVGGDETETVVDDGFEIVGIADDLVVKVGAGGEAVVGDCVEMVIDPIDVTVGST